ncbi:hypothetical protein ACP275_04G217400 [Erythranthe tilingii]
MDRWAGGGSQGLMKKNPWVGGTYTIGSQGLTKELRREGKGLDTPNNGDEVTVHYIGLLEDGTKFDSTVGKKPLTFTIGQGQVIQGLDEGIKTMKEEEGALFTIPACLAYGESAVLPTMNTLSYHVILLSWVSLKDICKDGGILKKILKQGESWETPKDHHEVFVEFEAKLEDGIVVSKSDGVGFTVSEGHFCPALPIAVKTMKKGEEVLLTVKPQYGFGEKGKRAYGGDGAVPPNATLHINLKLVSWKRDNKELEEVFQLVDSFVRLFSQDVSEQKRAAYELDEIGPHSTLTPLFTQIPNAMPQLLAPLIPFTLSTSQKFPHPYLQLKIISVIGNLSFSAVNYKAVAESPLLVQVLTDALMYSTDHTKFSALTAFYVLLDHDPNMVFISESTVFNMMVLLDNLIPGNNCEFLMYSVNTEFDNYFAVKQFDVRESVTLLLRIFDQLLINERFYEQLVKILPVLFRMIKTRKHYLRWRDNDELCMEIIYSICSRDRLRKLERYLVKKEARTISEVSKDGTPTCQEKGQLILQLLESPLFSDL